LDKVVERYQREELRDADRREQKLLDEFAGRPRQDRSS
jgi:flagellar biosynthesis chaperone FliJ